MQIIDIRPGQMSMLSDSADRYHQMINIGQYNEDVFIETWNALMRSTKTFVLAAMDNGEVVGAIGCIVCNAHSTSEVVGTIGFWFVHPERRGSVGGRLFVEAEQRLEELGVDRINAMLTVSGPTPKIADSLKRRGYRLFEVVYTKTIDKNDFSLDSSFSRDEAESAEHPGISA